MIDQKILILLGLGVIPLLRFLEHNSETTKASFLKPCDFSYKYIDDVLKAKPEI